MRVFGVLSASLLLTCAGCHSHGMKVVQSETVMPPRHAGISMANATLSPASGSAVTGSITLTPDGDGVRLQGQLNGLQPNSTHGFHIHEKGNCSAPDGSSAGGHFNPFGMAHGNPAGMPHHAGDIPNQTADAQGVAMIDVVVRGISLGTGAADDVLGRSVVVHRDHDDYATQPAGNSGARVACGVITGRRNEE
jgi:Cu-Zn family superoxide dismutase